MLPPTRARRRRIPEFPGQVCPRAPTRQAACPFRDPPHRTRPRSVPEVSGETRRICTGVRGRGWMAGQSRTVMSYGACSVTTGHGTTDDGED
ncbi:hypothetical protein BN2537_8901 [Streptomyces venezuelae]|nr:hypothetical protein BN2537_8901 [Streptomyces venezuelae]